MVHKDSPLIMMGFNVCTEHCGTFSKVVNFLCVFSHSVYVLCLQTGFVTMYHFFLT